jgi:hypothetical protein
MRRPGEIRSTGPLRKANDPIARVEVWRLVTRPVRAMRVRIPRGADIFWLPHVLQHSDRGYFCFAVRITPVVFRFYFMRSTHLGPEARSHG